MHPNQVEKAQHLMRWLIDKTWLIETFKAKVFQFHAVIGRICVYMKKAKAREENRLQALNALVDRELRGLLKFYQKQAASKVKEKKRVAIHFKNALKKLDL